MKRGGGVSVGLLGPLKVGFGERVLGPRDFGGRKPKQVLEILLVHLGRPVPKERIADLVWGQCPPRDPMRTLEAYVSVTRARLHPDPVEARRLLRSEPGAYCAVLEDAEIDLWRFDDLVSRAAAAPGGERLGLLEQALAEVRGDLLADEPYADWAAPLRDLYGERHVQVLVDAAAECLAASLPDQAVGYAERALEAQPVRERAYRLLIAAHYMSGDQDLALRAYERCRQVLDDELGVRPLAETEKVYLAVLKREPIEALALAPRPRQALTVRAQRPETRFARSGEAVIAYQALGDGSVDVVFAHGWFSHMEVSWEEPRYAAFLRRLARGRRLLLFDRRGMGMSDPASPSVSLEERADDIQAVMDDAGSGRAVIFGSCGAGPLAISLAARAPQRVAGLILFGTFPRMLATSGYPAGMSLEFFENYKAGLEQGWLTGRGVRRSVPTAGADEALMEWLGRFLRLSVSPAAARAILDFGATIDVRPILGDVTTPTLVMHRTNDQWVHPDNGRHLAAHIPGARFIELPGTDHWPWFGDADSVLRRVEEFLDTATR